MNLKQLEAFVQVAEEGSFSKAAKELFLTQPTISAHIASLEKELNVRLFIRNTKEVSLSEDGKELYKYAKPMMDLERKIEERFGSGEDTAKHCITIAASTVPAQYLLPEILKRYNEKYPKEQLIVGCASTLTDQDQIDEICKEIAGLFPDMQFVYQQLPSSVACHTGPGTFGGGIVRKLY